MIKEKSRKIYERLEKAIIEEDCTYEEAKEAVNQLREVLLRRKADNFLKKTMIKEIASEDDI